MQMYLVMDFDSTFVQVEALDELARIVLKGAMDREARTKRIEEITRAGMEGKIGFGESLSRRLDMFAPRQSHINELVAFLSERVTKSVSHNREWLLDNADQVYVISGGFREFIVPVVREFGIAPDHVLANTFERDDNGTVTGCDRSNPLAQDDGKVKAVRELGLDGYVMMVGDGYSDWIVRDQGAADAFVAFTENELRPEIAKRADWVAKSFDEIINSDILAGFKTARV